MQLTTLKEILKNICQKHDGGCNWKAKKYIWFSHVKLTKTKAGHSDLIEFRTRLKKNTIKEPNVKFYKLDNPVMSTGVDWYIGEYKRTKKVKKTKSKKTKSKKTKSKKTKVKKTKSKKTKSKKTRAKKTKTKKTKSKKTKTKSSFKNKNFAKIVRTVKDCLTYKCQPHKLGSKSYKECIDKNCKEEFKELQKYT